MNIKRMMSGLRMGFELIRDLVSPRGKKLEELGEKPPRAVDLSGPEEISRQILREDDETPVD